MEFNTENLLKYINKFEEKRKNKIIYFLKRLFKF